MRIIKSKTSLILVAIIIIIAIFPMSAFATNAAGGNEDVLLGDVNGDKTFDALDLATLKAYLLNPEIFISFKNADINEDGAVDALDYAAIISELHRRPPFPL